MFCLTVLALGFFLGGCMFQDMDPPLDPSRQPYNWPREGQSSSFSSLYIKGNSYTQGTSAPVQLLTGEVFEFKVHLHNNGTTTWGKDESLGEHGASLLSRGDPGTEVDGTRPGDYNETFGAFFILYPMQFGIPHNSNDPTVLPGQSWEIDTLLRAPDEPGFYTMRWQSAEWPLGTTPGIHHSNTTASSNTRNSPYNYFNRPFFGEEIVVHVEVVPRNEAPPVHHRKPGVLDQFDLEYQGSFLLPPVSNPANNSVLNRAYVTSGITLRHLRDPEGHITETRLLAVAGTQVNANVLYEVIVPPSLGQVSGAIPLPTAELSSIFTGQNGLLINEGGGSVGWSLGSMWLDEKTALLYWTNSADYPASQQLPGIPFLFYAKIDFAGGTVSARESWGLLAGGAPFGGFMGGVTPIPDSVAPAFGGRKLAIGFGGGGSISSIRSFGPSLGAVSLGENGVPGHDFTPFLFYPADPNEGLSHCIRDGSYLALESYYANPLSPWEGRWTGNDTIRTGVFIDYKGKQGYLAFANQVIGRSAYDFGGRRFFLQRQNAWYFYDLETLSKAAQGQIPGDKIIPSSYNVADYPTSWASPHRTTNVDTYMEVTGSCFDPDTGLLYLYVRFAYGNEPLVHVYRVKEG
ncbi:MAG: hypothetical protein FWH12_06555 [Treponema sp.]|nr:hypothetical protein [Treponema sp.]